MGYYRLLHFWHFTINNSPFYHSLSPSSRTTIAVSLWNSSTWFNAPSSYIYSEHSPFTCATALDFIAFISSLIYLSLINLNSWSLIISIWLFAVRCHWHTISLYTSSSRILLSLVHLFNTSIHSFQLSLITLL